MNFSYNLKKIIEIIECTNIELSRVSNLDQTIISKFKNNIRIPTIGSTPFNSLINGLCTLTIKNDKLKQINDLCGIEETLFKSIYNYLVNNSIDIRLNKDNDSLIGSSLEKLMKTFNISNVKLAKYLNKDGSLISKYKNGKRYILKNDNVVVQICKYFENYIAKNNLLDEAYLLFNTNRIDNLKDCIFNYLFTGQREKTHINNLLESINDFKFEVSHDIPSFNSLISDEIINSKSCYYIGTDEFRNSIKRFLGTVCISKTPTTLYLYSDENMKWMFQNKSFYSTRKILMLNCLIKKTVLK